MNRQLCPFPPACLTTYRWLAGFPFDELNAQPAVLGSLFMFLARQPQKNFYCGRSHLVFRLVDGGDGGMDDTREFEVIETDERQVVGNAKPAAHHGLNDAKGHYVIGRENCRDLRVFVQ